jgi:hypothetical protein
MQKNLPKSWALQSLPVNSHSWERLPPSTLPAPTSSWDGDNFFYFFGGDLKRGVWFFRIFKKHLSTSTVQSGTMKIGKK